MKEWCSTNDFSFSQTLHQHNIAQEHFSVKQTHKTFSNSGIPHEQKTLKSPRQQMKQTRQNHFCQIFLFFSRIYESCKEVLRCSSYVHIFQGFTRAGWGWGNGWLQEMV